jgi:hypothetical protein
MVELDKMGVKVMDRLLRILSWRIKEIFSAGNSLKLLETSELLSTFLIFQFTPYSSS